MNYKALTQHWPATLAEAKTLQQSLCSKVIFTDNLKPVEFVAGVDVGFDKPSNMTRGAIVVLRFPSLEVVDYATACVPTTMPYIPGYLSFRECPAILTALDQLKVIPDLLLCDGQGIAHPRRFGIASHLGVLTGIPSVGVAKSRLIGTHVEPPEKKGTFVPLQHHNETIGAVLRSREKTKPLYISVGHKVCLDTAIDFVMQCLTRYRLPETTRWADGLASQKATFVRRLTALQKV